LVSLVDPSDVLSPEYSRVADQTNSAAGGKRTSAESEEDELITLFVILGNETPPSKRLQ